MSNDLIALAVALSLGAAVVILGLRRNLSEITRNGMPRFGGGPKRGAPTPGLYLGEQGRRRPVTNRERRRMALLSLLFSLSNAAMAVLWASDRQFNAVFAVLWALVAGRSLQRLRQSPKEAAS